MKIIVCFFLLSSIFFAQEVTFYDLDLEINTISKRVIVDGELNIDFHDKDTADFVLWKNTVINEISAGRNSFKYYFDTSSSSPIMYIPNGRRLSVYKSNEENIKQIHFNYEMDMSSLGGWAKSFTEDWIELNFYSAWFPILGWNAKAKINISIDDAYKVSGSGLVKKVPDGWEMTQPWGGYDFIIVASKNLRTKELKTTGSLIKTNYALFSESGADSIMLECNNAINIFSDWFGRKDSTYLNFTIAPFDKGGGYSRKYFVRMGTTHFDIYTIKGIAHEIAHFWWCNAQTTSWEDWLNEAFAEYSMLMFVRERIGEKIYNELLNEYRERVKNLPSVWGINRNSPEAYSVLYEKGSLILSELENNIGKGKFILLLREISKNKISTTDALLNLIGKNHSVEISNWLKKKLES